MDIDMTTNAKIMHNIIYDNFGRWAKTSLCSNTKNHFKEWLMNQKRPNHFPRPLILNVSTTIFFSPHVYQLHATNNIWLEVYVGIIFFENCLKCVSLIKMAPSKIHN
jgi:hypothetical protein